MGLERITVPASECWKYNNVSRNHPSEPGDVQIWTDSNGNIDMERTYSREYRAQLKKDEEKAADDRGKDKGKKDDSSSCGVCSICGWLWDLVCSILS